MESTDQWIAFEQRFGHFPEMVALAPGRVNLIGGHLDYHEGVVFPLAIDRCLAIYAGRRPDSTIRIYSEAGDAEVELDLRDSTRHSTALGQYCQGALVALSRTYRVGGGCDALISGNLPAGAGLSSSSALVVAFIAVLARQGGYNLEPLELARLASDAEHWFGTTGGIMDQYVITHGRARHALLIDCRALTHEYFLLPEAARVVIAHTGSPRHQPGTPFARRRQEAEAGLQVLRSALPGVKTLRDITPDLLKEHEVALLTADPSRTLWRRCRHVVTEIARVGAAATAFAASDVRQFGTLMNQAHASLRDDYEVSSPDLDAMFEAAVSNPACYGARMTGGGFGGCTVNLVAADQVQNFCDQLEQRYRAATRLDPTIFATEAGDGLKVVDLP